MRSYIVMLLIAGILTGCGAPSVNVEKEREALLQTDREWAGTIKDTDKFLSYFASDATVYPPGMPMATGSAQVRETITKMMSAPGFALTFAPTKAVVSASGDVGYTAGTYDASMGGVAEKGKYITVWKKQADGSWKATDDIFNADAAPHGGGSNEHVMAQAAALKWGDAPPSLPAGSKIAVVSGDPSKPGPFVVRVQTPAGYKIAPHWHPGDENLTVLSGNIAIGMGDAWDEAKMEQVGPGGYVGLPAQMRHSFLAKSAATFQIHGTGPLEVIYVNPKDDPRKK
jgi:ketosteroid isomerase-like protein/quercetin dioxygenase-like cupin family protein